jgi:hypothetical protein
MNRRAVGALFVTKFNFLCYTTELKKLLIDFKSMNFWKKILKIGVLHVYLCKNWNMRKACLVGVFLLDPRVRLKVLWYGIKNMVLRPGFF